MTAVQSNAAGMATIAAAAAALAFNPAEALLGRLLGISGIVRGLVNGSAQAWRVAFVAGIVAGGFALQLLLPSAFETLPAAYTIQRAVLAGLLVGIGAAMGSGYTSGHGVCGISRLSPRSLVATPTFMASAVLAAYAFRTGSVLGLPAGVAPVTTAAASAGATRFAAGLLAVAVLSMLGLATAGKGLTSQAFAATPVRLRKELAGAEELEETSISDSPPQESEAAQKLASLAVFTELLVGLLFALGLGVSGLTKPSKIVAFVSVLAGTFDPTLLLVMGGAWLVSIPAFQAMLRSSLIQRPVCAPSFDLPSKTQVDQQLVLGSLLFGAGWGIGGICPGPALVTLATLQPQVLVFAASMVAGMRLEGPVTKTLFSSATS
ncbi:hypothetical protein N2152v2_006243 [Parachlorella kessleri]